MGGAQRNARKNRQARSGGGTAQPAATPSAPRNSGDRSKIIIGVVVVVVLAGAAIGGYLYSENKKNATEGKDVRIAESLWSQETAGEQSPPADPSTGAGADGGSTRDAPYPVRRDDGAVVVGSDDAAVTMEVYEDFLCPACGAFEREFGDSVERAVRDGRVQVRYVMLPMLSEASDPPGYSLDSANAGLCAADAGHFPTFHKSLFHDQPEEGARGWDKQQLTKLGTSLGIDSPEFASCVADGTHDTLVEANLNQVRNNPDLRQPTEDGEERFGTPTVAVNGEPVDLGNDNWLDDLLTAE